MKRSHGQKHGGRQIVETPTRWIPASTGTCVAVLVVWFALTVAAFAAPPSPNYSIESLSEDFLESGLNTEIWQIDYGAETIRVPGDDYLHIDTKLDGTTWRSGGIYSGEFQQRFGYFEASIKIAGDAGLTNSFWINTPHELHRQLVDRAEIDIAEAHYPHLAQPPHGNHGNSWDEFHVHTSFADWVPGAPVFNSEIYYPDLDLSEDFHTYAFEWLTDNTMRWYFDGQIVRTLTSEETNSAESLVPKEILLSSFVKPEFSGPPGPNLDGTEMLVDYVRVYQKPGWSGIVNGAWNDPGNWGTDGVPGSGQTAMFNQAAGTSNIQLSGDTAVQALFFDTPNIPAFMFSSGHQFLLGATTTTSGIAGITINNSVTQSQTINTDILVQQRLILSNLTDPIQDVHLNIGGAIHSISSDQSLSTMGFGRINIDGAISANFDVLTKDGRGELRLAGANEYTGPTRVVDGTLIIAADALKNTPGPLGSSTAEFRTSWWPDDGSGATQNRVSEDTKTRDLAILVEGPSEVGRDIFIGNYNYFGTTTIGGTTADTATFSGELTLSRLLRVVAQDGGSVVLSGPLLDFPNCQENCTLQFQGAITKVGPGIAAINSTASYTGPTIVEEGTLLVNGSTHSSSEFSVQAAATLGGIGNIQGPVGVENGGMLAPGASTGGLTVGSLTLQPGATTQFEIGGNTPGIDYDQIVVSGDAALGGALEVEFLPGTVFSPGDRFEIMTFGSRVGEFAEEHCAGLSGEAFLLPVYDATSLTL